MRTSLLLTLLLGIVFFVASHFFHPAWLHPYWPYLLLFYAALSLLLHRLIGFVKDPKSGQFITFFMTFVVIKFILSIVFVGILLYNHVPQRATFVAGFLVLYLVYTSFEIYGLTRKLRRDS